MNESGVKPFAFDQWLALHRDRCESALDRYLPAVSTAPEYLHEAMRYAVMGGGKRVRALLVYAAGQACQANSEEAQIALDAAAVAVEAVHAYSLVHDDLPCMDNDILRRGLPTVHVKYGEARALLAGDALQPLAFEVLAGMPIAPALVVQACQMLAKAIGSVGMVGGQDIDVQAADPQSGQQRLSLAQLETMHRLKTGALLRASVGLGAIAANASASDRQALEQYAQSVGLAFQVVDDILDVTADSQTLGKTAGKDEAANKPTYVSLMGLNEAKVFAESLRLQAHEALAGLGDGRRHAEALAQIADFVVLRTH